MNVSAWSTEARRSRTFWMSQLRKSSRLASQSQYLDATCVQPILAGSSSPCGRGAEAGCSGGDVRVVPRAACVEHVAKRNLRAD
jgi:hypothetical protein